MVAHDPVGAFYATASGGIGWGVPAAVGVALGDRASGVKRTVVATIGDGSFQYSVQAIWTAVQHDLPIVFVVMRNKEYSILKAFALLEKAPGVPGMDLPGLDIVSIATGFTPSGTCTHHRTARRAVHHSPHCSRSHCYRRPDPAADGPPWLTLCRDRRPFMTATNSMAMRARPRPVP